MGPTEHRVRIVLAFVLAIVFIGYFFISYQADAAAASVYGLSVDGLLLGIGALSLYAGIRGIIRLAQERSNSPRRGLADRVDDNEEDDNDLRAA